MGIFSLVRFSALSSPVIGAVLVAMLFMQTEETLPVEVRPPWQSQFPVLERREIVVGETPLVVEFANEPWSRRRGLSYREGLLPGTGMLFDSLQSGDRAYWMKGMRFCLDIVWIDDGQIQGAAENACPDPVGTADADRERFPSNVPVRFGLEVPAGWLAEHGYGPGTPVEGLPE